MPDMEKLTDDLALHLVGSDAVKLAYERGYIAGKNRARIEITVLCSLIAIAISVIRLAA